MDRKYALYMRASFICAVYQHASESDIAIRLHSFWSLSFKLNVEIYARLLRASITLRADICNVN